MSKIKKLSPILIAKIKAGEVIERPAYAVKELLENAIDAGAKNISISVENSGLKKIVITDDGEGMSREDLELALKPHTTSKIQTEDELLQVASFGFRGEALSSIAAISTITIESRNAESPLGNSITIKNGKQEKSVPLGMPEGTRVIIENLFASVPARKKFLKSLRTEYRHILDIVLHYVVSNPAIHFSFTNNKRQVFDLPSVPDVISRIQLLIGNNLFEQLVPIQYDDAHVSIRGFVGKPHVSFGTQQKQFLFVNKRKVTDKPISLAVKESFGTMLDASSYPMFILFLTLPYELVDVNVHPRKEQVSFVNQSFVFSHVKEAIQKTLNENNLTFANISWKKEFGTSGNTDSFAAHILKEKILSKQSLVKDANLQTIQQIHNLYLLIETKQGMLVIDQHAAHERILFEKLHKEFIKQKKKTKPYTLKNPIPLTFSMQDYALLLQQKKYFSKLGFLWKDAKQNSIILTSLPHLLKDRNPQELLIALLSDISSDQGQATKDKIDQQSYKMLAYLACHAAVKAGDILTKKQMQELVEQLEKTENNYTCPHGRPTRIELSLTQLNTYFKR